jgi:hypothetical protein
VNSVFNTRIQNEQRNGKFGCTDRWFYLDVFYVLSTLDMSNTWNLGSLRATLQGEQRMSYMQEAVREWV